MTVCIAAKCIDGAENRIVLCTDRRSGSALGSAETALKDRTLPHGWRCLTAGTEADIVALIRLYREAFVDPGNLAAVKIDATIKGPLFRRKKELAEEYIRNRFAISHAEFISLGKEKFPADIFHDALQRVSLLDLKADLIVAGFIDGAEEIYRCSSAGKVIAAYEYAVIGSGEYLAEASLLRRGQNDVMSLDETIYNVYEAKKHSEAVGSVGRQTSIYVLSRDGSHRAISVQLQMQLGEMFDKYGPKPVPRDLTFEGARYYDQEVAASAGKSADETC